VSELDRDIVGTCAYVAAYLTGVRTHCLWEGDRDRGFTMIGADTDTPRVWDPQRASYVHIHTEDDGWWLYDFASAHHLRAQGAPEELVFTDDAAPSWCVRTGVVAGEVHTRTPDGDHYFRIGPSVPRGTEAAEISAMPLEEMPP
jgi:hypothetical protein